jgi:hypothetical protein
MAEVALALSTDRFDCTGDCTRARLLQQVLESWAEEHGATPKAILKKMLGVFAFSKTPKGAAIMALIEREVNKGKKILIFSGEKTSSGNCQLLPCHLAAGKRYSGLIKLPSIHR